jgi:Asp-tRNA(Asn)/Glu-tRNA(Gln) amidotransferase A subunit family amidase
MSETTQRELTSLPASELAGLIAARQVSATEAVTAHVERIQALDFRVRAVVVPLYEQAMAESGRGRSPQRDTTTVAWCPSDREGMLPRHGHPFNSRSRD